MKPLTCATAPSACHPLPSPDPELSIIVPLHNEADVVRQMHQRLRAVLTRLGLHHEVLFVNDGSRDGTQEILQDIAIEDPAVRIIRLARPHGKESARIAGMTQCLGQVAIMMNGDLRDPPECIPDMLTAWRQGADAVRMCQKPGTMSPLAWLPGTHTLPRLISWLTGIPPTCSNTDFMLCNRKALMVLNLVTDRKRYVDAVFAWAGVHQTMIEYRRQDRPDGASQWKLPRLTPRAGAAARLHRQDN